MISLSGASALPHHDGSALYVSDLQPSLGQSVTVWLRVGAEAGVERVFVRSTPDGEPRFSPAVSDQRVPADRVPGRGNGAGRGDRRGEVWWRAEVEVRNPDTRYRFLLHGPGGQHWLNALGLFAHDLPDAHDFRLLAWDPPPAWAQDAVVYEIFPDRFARSAAASDRPVPDWAISCNWDTPVIGRGPETPYQLYGGDLDGVAEHLDHIASLGVDTVYLTPIFPARSNHRYDAASFSQVDPLLGGEEALARLSAALHARGMRLLGDLTTNHCGESHPWFQAALADRTAPERELFYFDGDDYEAWCGVKSLPKLNWGSGELRRRFVEGADSVTARWLRPPFDLDGWRVDVANMTGRLGADAYTVEAAQLVRRAVAGARPDGLVVAEHNYDATADLDRDGWHGTMNYAGFLRPVWNWLRADGLGMSDFLGVPGDLPRRGGLDVVATMRSFAALMSWRSWVHSWTFLGTHDSPRVQTIIGDAGRTEVALGLQMTLPGVPMVFAGDELGLEGRNGEDGRRPMPWHGIESWDRVRLGRYRDLIALRRRHETLSRGGLRWVHADAESVTYARETEAETLLVHARRAAGEPVLLRDLGPAAENVYGGASVDVLPDGSVRLPAEGPTFQVWRIG